MRYPVSEEYSKEFEVGFTVKKPQKKPLKGHSLYDVITKDRYKSILVNTKEFLKKYYQELTYQELIITARALYNISLSTSEIKNLCLGMNLVPKNVSASSRKFVKKEFSPRVARGLWLEYWNYWECKPIKLKPN